MMLVYTLLQTAEGWREINEDLMEYDIKKNKKQRVY